MSEKNVTNPYYAYGILHLSENFHRFEASKGAAYRKYRHEWVRRPKELDRGAFPLNINFEVTTRCNLACTFCTQPTLTDDQLGDLDPRHFQKVVEEAEKHHTPAANFNGLGEPSLVKKLPEMLKYAKDHGFIDIMFHTNGTVMTEAFAQRLLDSGVDRVIFSVDSPDKKTYEAMRLKSNFERVVGNVKFFAAHREKKGRTTPIIRSTMVVTDETAHQVEDFVGLWKGTVDQITVQDLVWRTKRLEEGDWANGRESAIPIDMDKVRDEAIRRKIGFTCPYLYQSTYVFWNGDIIPCSNPNARKYMILGQIEDQSLEKIWNGKPYGDLRKLHETGRWHEHPICRNCEIPLIEMYKTMRKEDGFDAPSVAGAKGSADGNSVAVPHVASQMAAKSGKPKDLVTELTGGGEPFEAGAASKQPFEPDTD